MKIVICKTYSVVMVLKMSVDDACWTTSFLRKVKPRDHAREGFLVTRRARSLYL